MLTQVLPAASDRAKDLGVINVATALPLVVAPLIAGIVLSTLHSYPALFALSGVATWPAACPSSASAPSAVRPRPLTVPPPPPRPARLPSAAPLRSAPIPRRTKPRPR